LSRSGLDDCGGGLVLSGVDVAGAPPDVCAHFGQSFDQDGGLDRHVQRPHDTRAGKNF